MSNLADAVFAHAFSEPERVAVRADGYDLTFGALRDAAAALAARARRTGLAPGDRALLVAPTVPEFVAASYGLAAAGATLLTLDPRATASETRHVVDDADVRLVVAWHECADAAERTALARDLPFWRLDPLETWDLRERVFAPVELPDQATALIATSSGTASRPRFTGLSLASVAGIVDTTARAWGFDEDDRAGTALPLSDVFGQLAMHLAISAGTAFSLLHPFDPHGLVARVRGDELSIVSALPSTWRAVLHDDTSATWADFAGVRLASTGGAPLPVEVAWAFEKRFGVRLHTGHGSPQTFGPAAVSA